MRPPKAWFWSDRDAWFTELGGKRIKLALGKDNKREAEQALRRLLVDHYGEMPSEKQMTFAELADLFLDYCLHHCTPYCYQSYRYYLQSFCELVGTQLVTKLKPFQVTKWLERHPNWKGSQRHAIGTVQRTCNWAISQGLIANNPFRGIKKPGSKQRTRILTKDERKAIMETVRDESFRDFLFALQETGCRPSEVARVTAADVNLEQGIWFLARHKTMQKTGRPRIIYLTPAMIELSKRLMEINPTGPLFRNRRGVAYNKNSLQCRFRRLSEKLGLTDVVCYSYRHTYATEALVNGVGIAQVSELLGHTSTEMVMKHYGHLAQQVGYMREAALRATGRLT